uniref:Arsenite methyltransferase n=1 Tax=Haptolina ericina TaxID=156174 RepID=A0A7S3BT41_9EUKA|eukprot:CAMPEP_0181256746 /NCGR_PEP_ID=MMETSP1096-20121128/49875_1 /TAXON_ID=156174 ORGANISM="Chrysochromulina ericina, Strain CCMP281" /NCGR_SAMPLE_ID=MMETSP1096 /ASSEMBLY_ACC=CAM_ASM_000453 /LENGTH=360 /DNA_ID=CAMNT_0023355017 /DNA_START=20 /DNA_END=1102 /DNA_ORIENTATION=-
MALDALAVQNSVKTYYGETLSKSGDLKTNACCTGAAPPPKIREALRKVHPEVKAKYYGCGLCLPDDDLAGLSVLDLGCGAGRDCYLLSQLVGESGRVVGVDMTEAQLAVAREHQEWHAQEFGFASPNTEFKEGVIEDLGACGLEDASFDVIVSNCVINLASDKRAVLRDAFRVLKQGGELYFSDVYASRRMPADLAADPVLYGECLSGALYWNDFLALAKECGFTDPRLVEDAPITINNAELEDKVGQIKFFSATYRLFKLPTLLDADCEDYGQAVIYKGTIPGKEDAWSLDGHHFIEKGKVFPVCGNTYHMLHDTRLAPHFEFIGDKSTHYGIFEGCGKALPFGSAATAKGGAAAASCC